MNGAAVVLAVALAVVLGVVGLVVVLVVRSRRRDQGRHHPSTARGWRWRYEVRPRRWWRRRRRRSH